MQRLSFKRYLDKIKNEDRKKHIARLLKTILEETHLPYNDGEPITLQLAYEAVGRAVMQVEMITELNKILMSEATCYTAYLPWADELWQLREQMNKQISLCRELVRSVIYHNAKEEKENAKTDTTTGTETRSSTPNDGE